MHFLGEKKSKKSKKIKKNLFKFYGNNLYIIYRLLHIIYMSCDFLGFWRTKMEKCRNIFYFHEILGESIL